MFPTVGFTISLRQQPISVIRFLQMGSRESWSGHVSTPGPAWTPGPGLGTPGQTGCCWQTRSPSPCGLHRRCRRSNERPRGDSAWGYITGTGWGSWYAAQSGPRIPRIGKFWLVCRPLTWTESPGTSRGRPGVRGTTSLCRMWSCSCNVGAISLFLFEGPHPQGSLKHFMFMCLSKSCCFILWIGFLFNCSLGQWKELHLAETNEPLALWYCLSIGFYLFYSN